MSAASAVANLPLGTLSSCHFVEHSARSVDVSACICRLSSELFGCHVRQCSGANRCATELVSSGYFTHWPQELREAEVEDFYLPVWCHNNVSRLQIAMYNAVLVCLLERLDNLHSEVENLPV